MYLPKDRCGDTLVPAIRRSGDNSWESDLTGPGEVARRGSFSANFIERT